VVNEPIQPNSNRPDRLRDSQFLQALGPRYMDIAFHAARAANPRATLVLNDWVAPYQPDFFGRHRDAMLVLLERLKKDGVPVDALGIQGHLIAARPDFDTKTWSRFLSDVTELGLDILVTELDVADKGLPPEAATRDQITAAHAKLFLDVTLANARVTDVLTWGLSDAYSAVRLYHKREDGLRPRSLPYDEHLTEKPMRAALAAALAAAPARRSDPLGLSQ
jgi:endo-1,4-beta-xylanase